MTTLANQMSEAINEMAASFFDVPSRIGNQPSVLPAEVEDYFLRKIYDYVAENVLRHEQDVVFDYELHKNDVWYTWTLRISEIDAEWLLPYVSDPWGDELTLHRISLGSLDCSLDVCDDYNCTFDEYVVPIDEANFEKKLNNFS